VVLSAVAFFTMIGVSIVSPVIPDYALSFGVSYALAGLLVSGFGVARLFLDLPAGILSQRFGPRRFMLLGLGIIASSSMIAGFAPDYSVLLAARVLEGIGSAVFTTTSLTAVTRMSPRESRGADLSLYMSMYLIGTVIGPVIGGVAAEGFGLGAPFIIYGLFALFSILLVWKTIPQDEAAEAEGSISFGQLFGLLKRYDVLTISFATFCVFIARQGILNTIVPLFARINIGLTLADLGIVLSIGAVGNLASMLMAGTLTDRYGRKPFFLAGLGLTALFTAMLPFASDIVQLTAVVAGLSLSLGLAGPMAAWLTDVVKPGELGGAMGLFRTFGDLGFVLAPVMLASLAGSGTLTALPFLLAAGTIIMMALPLVRTSDPIGEQRRAMKAERRKM